VSSYVTIDVGSIMMVVTMTA